MERCRWCRSDDLDQVEYIEVDLFGTQLRVIITYCNTCGNAETVGSKALPAPA
jgi:hypothetical protein